MIDEIRRQTAVIERIAERIERLEQALLQLPAPAKQEKPAGKRHDFSDLLDKLKQNTENG